MWIDTNQCPESFHAIRQEPDRGVWVVLHIDDSECEATEFDLERDED